ncbi:MULTISPECIES: hypothetical protein [unclassified Mesorhizobium]|uniref:hypothetical protein n=1 Tax=unclassified Mesorhizobium TaxID=325217 RepID=UPI00112B8FF1|nr:MULTISPECIES: hypothetical protein [unclassified Mesorhizobium]MCA0000969.1 hypothetical protein [Mesorhizobium sp. B264B2A]MCA0004718.1 hypothetical protein [Mesorhizobium sp. B264B1B]MCA0019083.1 hypothetical protein [Mesorhizobium sp. B264B1A]TPJ38196.1 hypothetical protein FJ437_30950 [Mesorhizobium sp. B2-6-6]
MEISIDETTKRSLAVEGALLQLVVALVSDEKLKAGVGLDILRMLSLSSNRSTDRLALPIESLERLKVIEDREDKG